MLKFIRAWYRNRRNVQFRLLRWQTEARYWREKYRSLKRWKEEIHDEVHSYEGGSRD